VRSSLILGSGAAISWGIVTFQNTGSITKALTVAFAVVTTLCAFAVLMHEEVR
jgi:hypothetical protein